MEELSRLAEAEFFRKENHRNHRRFSSSIDVDLSSVLGFAEEEDHDSLHLSFRPTTGRRNLGALGTSEIPFLKKNSRKLY